MAELTRFDCPHCRREYQLSIPAEKLMQSRKRALCTRCGERFEIRARLQELAAEDDYEVLVGEAAEDEAGAPAAPPVIAEAIQAAVPAHLEPVAGEQASAEEDRELLVPPPLDWLAFAGAGEGAAACGDPGDPREADLRELLDGG